MVSLPISIKNIFLLHIFLFGVSHLGSMRVTHGDTKSAHSFECSVFEIETVQCHCVHAMFRHPYYCTYSSLNADIGWIIYTNCKSVQALQHLLNRRSLLFLIRLTNWMLLRTIKNHHERYTHICTSAFTQTAAFHFY